LHLLAHHGRRVRMATKGDLADHDVEL